MLSATMESAFEKTARLLLTEHNKEWTGLELSARTGYSRGMISRVLKRLEQDTVVAKPYKNRFVLVEPIRLLMLWSCERVLPNPVYIDSHKSDAELNRAIARMKGVALTQFRSAWLRSHYMRTTSYELYVPQEKTKEFARRLGRISDSPQKVALLPADKDVFLGSERVAGLPVVSLPQNFVDLMCTGGSGPRVALHLGISTKLLGV
ncbi:MAG: hypothetical protein ACUVT7_02475 [Thermoplasmata archaeon]